MLRGRERHLGHRDESNRSAGSRLADSKGIRKSVESRSYNSLDLFQAQLLLSQLHDRYFFTDVIIVIVRVILDLLAATQARRGRTIIQSFRFWTKLFSPSYQRRQRNIYEFAEQ